MRDVGDRMSAPHEPSNDTARVGGSGFAVVLVLYFLAGSFWHGGQYPGEDSYVDWCVTRQISNAEAGDVYSEAGRTHIGQANEFRSREPGSLKRVAKVHERSP